MTITTPTSGAGLTAAVAPTDLVTVTIDGIETSVPQGTLAIRAAEEIGIEIPRFCDHPLLEPAGACRQCFVEVATPGRDGTLRAMPKPQASCTLEVSPGMVIKTQHTSPVAEKAQRGNMEFLLINHPLDCPVCDKGGECPLQNQAMSAGRSTSRFVEAKRTFAKPIAISTQILLDRERCISCVRCTRFSEQIAGDPFIELQERGARQQIGLFSTEILGFSGAEVPVGAAAEDTSGRPFGSYFSGNTVQICPVGALTSAAYRFRSRPFDLVSTPSVAEHDANCSAIRIDHRRGAVLRRLSGDDAAVNEEWITDKDRFAFRWLTTGDRITTPLVRGEDGELHPTSWAEALDAAATGLKAARASGGVGVLPGGRLTLEDAYAYAKFARVALGTNDVDFRARPHSAEEADFLAHHVAGAPMGVTFADLETAPAVLLVGFEPEEEGGIVFLRLRKGVLAAGTRVFSLAPFVTRGTKRLNGTLLSAAPGTEPGVLRAIASRSTKAELAGAAVALATAGAIILVGERLAGVPGALSAALQLAKRTGARLAWIPRRVGERAALEAGAAPNLLAGGRPLADPRARAEVAAVWSVDALPRAAGRDLAAILTAAAKGTLGGLVVGGVEVADLPRPIFAERAFTKAFVVSLEVRPSAITSHADVVLPVAPAVEKSGTFLTWEGRSRPFETVISTTAMPDHRVLSVLADALGVSLGTDSLAAVRSELRRLGRWAGDRAAAPDVSPAGPPSVGAHQAVLATWRLMLDSGRLQDGEPHLAGTAKRAVARLSAGTAGALGLRDDDLVDVSSAVGTITLPYAVTPMPDHVVWVPTNSVGSAVRATLGVDAGAVVDLSVAERTTEVTA